jgi:hypothetical protein
MKFSTIAAALISASFTNNKVSAFAPHNINLSSQPQSLSQHVRFLPTPISQPILHKSSSLSAQSTESDEGFFSDLTINPAYAAFYLTFVSIATYTSVTEAPGVSQALIDSFIADPLHPGFGSSLFETLWNCVGLVGLPLATVIMPGAKGQKFNPTPFLFASAFAGYGSLGLFMMARKPVVPSTVGNDKEEDLGWFTKNVLENKVFSWVLFAVLANAYVISGAAESLVTNPISTFQEFGHCIGGSALGTASTVDFTILCLTGASLVPEDLKRRGFDEEDNGKAYAIAASTVLFPGAGLALYSALRPSLTDEA